MSTAPPAPRISVNKLGEFLTTVSPIRRRAIVRQQKRPPSSVVPRYRQAIDPIEAFLASGGVDVAPMVAAINALRTPDNQASDWQRDDRANTADALERFLEVSDSLPLDGVTYVRGDTQPPRLDVAGVSISVRPDFLIQFQRRGGVECVGSLKIHYIRNDDYALSEGGQEYVATLCHKWLEQHGPQDRKPIHTHCFSLDLFRDSVVHAPASFTRRMNDVEAACQEIALVWPTLP